MLREPHVTVLARKMRELANQAELR
jgi:hypothetical protein